MNQIFVHGLGQTPASWEKTLLSLRNFERIICPNLTELVQGKEINYKNLYNSFSDICNKIDGSVDLCGLSLGGVLSLNYAIDYPEKVNSLILIAAQYKMPKRLLQFQNAIFRFMPKSMFQQMGFRKSEIIQLCRTMMELDFSKSLHKITCPVLVIYGAKDDANKNASVELTNILENAELEVINHSGHEVNIDAPEQLSKVLRTFYERLLHVGALKSQLY